MLNFFKRNFIVISLLLLQFLLYIAYIQRSSANIVFADQFHLLEFIDKYFAGKLTFQDLWRGHLEHRMLGYNLIFLGNAVFFHLNTMLEIYLGAFVLLLIAASLFYTYRESLTADSVNDKFIQLSFFIIAFLVFSLNQWENMVFSLGIAMMIKMLFLILTFITLDRLLVNDKVANKQNYLLILLISMTILLFGLGYSPAFVGSMLAVLFFKIFIERTISKKEVKLLFLVLITSTIVLVAYFYKVYDDNMIPEDVSILDRIRDIFSEPANASKYFLFSVCGSLFGFDFSERCIKYDFIKILSGLVIILFYLYSAKLFVASRMHKKTYLPMFLMFYPFFIFFMILVGRFSYGINYGMASRYVTSTQYGLIGVVWIIIYNARQQLYPVYFKDVWEWIRKNLVTLMILFFILTSQIVSDWEEWKIGPYRKMNFYKMRMIALNPERYTKDDLKLFQYPEDIVMKGLKVIKKYNLNVFYDVKDYNHL